MTQSGGGAEYSLGTATLTLRGDMQPLERDLAKMRKVIADMEKRGTNIPAPNIPPPPPETQRGYEGLAKTMEALRRGIQGDGEAFTMLSQQLRGAGEAAGAAAGGGGIGGMQGALGSLLGMAGKAVPILGQLGLAGTGLQMIFGGMTGAIQAVLGPLQQLSAEAGRLNKQVAEAGIFAAQSFAILGPDGKLVEGTARQMQMVRGAILKEYKGIQQEVASISGATAAQIYEGFNIILSNVGNLGEKGTTENAAKLATRMAAGMNTLGIPGYQLRQETNALMLGHIDRNAMMATKLGITGDDVRRQQAQGTYYDFLMKKLEKLYEGQKVLALSLANVKSNFDDINQAISSEAGQPLERDTATMMQSILVTFKNLQQSFTGFFRSIAEAVGPIIKVFGPVVSALTSIGAAASSVGQIILDVFGTITTAIGAGALPMLTATARSLELIARLIGLVAEGFAAGLNPIKSLINVMGEQNTAGVTGFFDQIFTGLDKVSGAIDAFNQKWAAMVLSTSLAGLRTGMKLAGKSDKEIATAENDFKDRYKLQTGLTEDVQLRSLKLPPNIANQIEELNARLGTGSARALNISKAWADIKQKAYQNEIKALEQGVSLMNKQKEIAEAMAAVGNARRALTARGYELGVQVAASPEAKLAAEARLADIKLSQEKEAIAERRGILQTEKEIQERQMVIQEKQIKIQQEQLKIQLAEARADQVRVANQTEELLKVRGNTKYRSPEYATATHELNILMAEGTRNVARIAGAKEALRLAFEAEAQLGTVNGLEAQRLGLQEQQLDIQGQAAQYTREQQALMAEISAAEQAITNELTRATNEQNRKKQGLEAETEEINRQIKLQEQQSRIEKARADLAATRAKAEVQAAQRLAEVQELQDRARSGGGTAAVIEAQIAAAAAGVSGMETAAEAQKRLYEARDQQMQREHQLQNRQLEVQQLREASEARIEVLKIKGQQVAVAIQKAQLLADLGRLGQSQQKDALSQQVAGASSVPGLSGATANILPGTKGGPNWNEGVGYGRGRLHAGQDLGTDPNDPVAARMNGVIEQAYAKGFGKAGGAVVIKYEDGSRGTYGHVNPLVATGQSVAAGQTIAKVTPDGTNSHLHYELRNARGQLDANPGKAIRAGMAAGGGAGGSLAPGKLRGIQLAMATAKAAGFTGEEAITMAAVIMAESSGNPRAHRAAGADNSYGLFQINMKGSMGPERRKALGLSRNEDLWDPAVNARAGRMVYDQQGITAWGAYTDGRYRGYLGQARAAAAIPALAGGGAAAAGPLTSSANQAQALRQGLEVANEQEGRLAKVLEDLLQWLSNQGNGHALEKENLTEQQLAERAQFAYEQRKAQLTAEILKTPEGRLGAAVGDGVSGSISSSLSGAMEALLNGGDVRQAVAGALAQAGQGLMQATMDALLQPLLAQIQGGLFKAITGVDIEAAALQAAAGTLQAAGGGLSHAAVLLSASAGQAAGASAFAGGGLGLASKLLGAVGGFSSFTSGMNLNVPALINTNVGSGFSMQSFAGAFTPGRAGGGEIEYGLDYLVGEKNAEIVRFNKEGGKVFSNRALTKALGVPFQRTPGGGAAVAEGGGDSLGVPFMAAGPARASGRGTPGIPFLKAPAGDGAGHGGLARRSSLRLSLETEVINGVEYATVAQVREAAAAAAEAGRDSAYDGMRNHPSIQRSLGMY